MLYDFHSHLHLYDDIEPIISEIKNNAIFTIAASVDQDSYNLTKTIGAEIPLILPTFGIHPSRAADYTKSLSALDKDINESKIIGEIGLDYLWVDSSTKLAQKTVFTYIAQKCVEQDKYMVIHTKDAEEDILDILCGINSEKVIIHWYSGPEKIYRKYIDMGWYFTFGVELNYSEHIRNLAKITPPERLLTETDNPVGEEWLSGRTGYPKDIIKAISSLAAEYNTNFSFIENIIETNSKRILQESGIYIPQFIY